MFALLRLTFAVLTLCLSSAILTNHHDGEAIAANTVVTTEGKNSSSLAEKYASWQLGKQGISLDLFSYAVKGYEYLDKLQRISNPVLTIIDFTKPSSQQRLFIINAQTGQILLKTLVAHGRNSGMEYASSFSNSASSYESSLGFYITDATYKGKHGYSLRLKGCEKGFNDNAYNRAIVVHGANYVSERFIGQNGYLGRSHGCPAVPAEQSKQIIDIIKGGSCMFIYSPSKKYLSLSAIINS